MNNEDDNFEQLWQQQSVTPVDVSALKQQLRKMRFKQFFYVFLDALSVASLPILLFFIEKKLTKTEFVAFTVLFIIVSLWFFYLLWLRRFSLRSSNANSSTADVIEHVKVQYQQNIRIAYINKVFCYFTPVIFVGFLVAMYLGDSMTTEVFWRKARVLSLASVIFLPITWVWADKRQKKFEKLLSEFNSKWASGQI